jgi:mannose-6-phosphate isomerase-like protein (cupin superfamily)
MSDAIQPIRRVVTGHDAQGRSCVLYDSAAPGVRANQFKKGTGMTDIWVWSDTPVNVAGSRDDGDVPFHFEPPHEGARVRVVESAAKPADYSEADDKYLTAEHPPRLTEGGTWERGRQNMYTTRIHKSETVDYGVVLSGERILCTDDGERTLYPGDVVVQVGSWHAWKDLVGSQMAFVMMAARFDDEGDAS